MGGRQQGRYSCVSTSGPVSGGVVEHIGTHASVLFEAPADLSDVLIHLGRIFIATGEAQEYFFRSVIRA